MKPIQTFLWALLLLVCPLSVFSQPHLLQSGPMVGYSTMKEVLLWVQTTESARVRFEYWEEGKPETRYATDEATTIKFQAFTAKLVADQVEPGRHYDYELFINDTKVERPYPLRFQTQKLWQWREDPPSFRIALGSGAYINEPVYDRPGKPYGGEYQIYTEIYKKHPDAMLWLGDNIYLREADWNSRTGIFHRNTHARSTPEFQPLLGSVHNYAIWDDHDFGPNNSDRSFWNKDVTLEGFKLFWGNPSFGVSGQPGTTTTFQWADVQFFLLDNRYYRTPNNRITGERTQLGEHQFQWLIDALVASHAPFKVIAIGGQVLNPVVAHETYARFAEERERLLRMIRLENIPGVIFLTGDRHNTEITRLERPGTYPLHDFTISPFTSGVHTGADKEPNYLRVEGTLVMERNFAIMEVTGPRKDRVMTMTVYSAGGQARWSHSLRAKDLR